jgi:glutathione S-transferase
MLTIWGRKNSINVQKVLWCCAELGLEYKRIDAGLQFGLNKTPDYLARNPNGLVPTIDDDGFVLWESNVIVRYLSSKHGPGTLCPTDLKERFLSERWMDWQITAAGPLGIIYRGLVRTPPEKRDNDAIAAAQGRAEALFRLLDTHLAGRDFVETGRFTIGDIPTGAIVYRWLGLGNKREDFPNLARYHDRLAERPPFREHVMLPFT